MQKNNLNNANTIIHNCKPTTAYIDLNAIKHNCEVIKQRVSNSKILAIVKSDAYGHGIVPVCRTLYNMVEAFGVAWLDEALKIRSDNNDKPILLLKGFITQEELKLISELELMTVIHNQHQLDLIATTNLTKPLKVWLKIDTGMHRLGFAIDKIHSAYNFLLNNNKIQQPITLMSHLANADIENDEYNSQQLDLFNRYTNNLPCPKSFANSASLWLRPETHFNWVRPGLLLYGASPFANVTGEDLGLKPAMTLKSKLLTIKHLSQGEKIGYGLEWTCKEDMLVGIINLGYGDGYPRYAISGTPVLIHKQRCPIVGRISMDMLAIDLRSCPHAKIGDSITLWGENLSIETIARYAKTIPHELLSHYTHRVGFEYHESQL